MAIKESITDLRKEIDKTDDQLIALFEQRMALAQRVADVKRDNNLSIMDEQREQNIVDRIRKNVESDLDAEATLLMRTVMALSREYQHRLLFSRDMLSLPEPQARKVDNVHYVYQGVPGAWSEQAGVQVFPEAEAAPVEYFEDVFLAVSGGKADYGIVPIENAQTGAVGETYDLLRTHGCYIVGRTRVPIQQCLVAREGVALEDIKEVLSHPVALSQCGAFLRQKHWQQTACGNTAVAAQTAAEATKGATAAIASAHAAHLYGLTVLCEGIQDARDNYTDFVVIASHPEYDEQSNMLTVTFSTKHRSGALCEALLPFMAEKLNLLRIESRPSAKDQYRFFADIGGNILEEQTRQALRQAASASEYFEIIGCYSQGKE